MNMTEMTMNIRMGSVTAKTLVNGPEQIAEGFSTLLSAIVQSNPESFALPKEGNALEMDSPLEIFLENEENEENAAKEEEPLSKELIFRTDDAARAMFLAGASLRRPETVLKEGRNGADGDKGIEIPRMPGAVEGNAAAVPGEGESLGESSEEHLMAATEGTKSPSRLRQSAVKTEGSLEIGTERIKNWKESIESQMETAAKAETTESAKPVLQEKIPAESRAVHLKNAFKEPSAVEFGSAMDGAAPQPGTEKRLAEETPTAERPLNIETQGETRNTPVKSLDGSSSVSPAEEEVQTAVQKSGKPEERLNGGSEPIIEPMKKEKTAQAPQKAEMETLEVRALEIRPTGKTPEMNHAATDSRLERNVETVQEGILRSMETVQREGKTTLKVRLHPEELGEMEIVLTLEKGKLTGRLLTETQEVRQLFQGKLQELSESLRSQNIDVAKFEISSGLQGGNSQQSRDFEGRRDQSAFLRLQHSASGYEQKTPRKTDYTENSLRKESISLLA